MKAVVYEIGELIEGTRLRYISEAPRTNPKRRRALFSCECGGSIEADLNYVRFKNITSCGCYRSELVAQKNEKHGHSTRGAMSDAYRSFRAMHQRVKSKATYAHVSICERWSGEDGFANFYADMGDRPSGHTIERIDNLGNYEPSNCKWATKHEQAQNQRHTVLVTMNGETRSIQEWCRVKGVSYSVVKRRRQKGISVEDALNTPLNESKRRIRK
jgi:hypothetical protein